jgi:hypothetical protein
MTSWPNFVLSISIQNWGSQLSFIFMEYLFVHPDLEGKCAVRNLRVASSINVIKCGYLFCLYPPLYFPFSIRKSGSDSRKAIPRITWKWKYSEIRAWYNRGAGVHRCSCVFLLNWKQLQCLLSFPCFYHWWQFVTRNQSIWNLTFRWTQNSRLPRIY